MDPASSPVPGTPPERDIYTVSRLNREVRVLLERGFGTLWIEAEISNFARPSSGHWYFSLKDANAQVRCAMFRQRNYLSTFTPKDGQKVLVRARIGLYEPRGEYQLIVDHIEDAGRGALQRQFEELRARLAAEGLFAAERKRPLPGLPVRIGIITSPTGAAVRDILHVLARRFPAIGVLIYPVQVQGAQAAADIVAALELAGRRADCDVLILARGGGSLEDLWAFNDERLARAIVASPIPIITGVGHEVDFTIADFAADVRAPTPSAAAELVVPDAQEWLQSFALAGKRLEAALRRRVACRQRLDRAWRQIVGTRGAALSELARTLNAVSPLATLERGYAIVSTEDGRILRDAADAGPGSIIEARLAVGRVRARVEGTS